MQQLLKTFWMLTGLCLVVTACSQSGPPQEENNLEPPPPTVDPFLVDCTNYAQNGSAIFRGNSYNCSALDRCNANVDPTALFACAECDPIFSQPDPSCLPPEERPPVGQGVESCMSCHNGAQQADDYAGPGLTNPHPFGGASFLKCTQCHGGNGTGLGKEGSHIPTPPGFSDQEIINGIANNNASAFKAYFNRLTLTGLDKMGSYTVNNQTYTYLEYLQFLNPGDLRVAQSGQSCGNSSCHGAAGDQHVQRVAVSPIALEQGLLSGALYSSGTPNPVNPGTQAGANYFDTAAEYGWRAQTDVNPGYDSVNNNTNVGRVPNTNEFPERAHTYLNNNQPNTARFVQLQTAIANDTLAADLSPDANFGVNRILNPESNLGVLFAEQVMVTCGDCHAGSSGANNRYADFRSSGCTSCHMQYSADGRSRSTDPNVPKNEPANPDAIDAALAERPHVYQHVITNVAKTIGGAFVPGIRDQACAGCHQGSNRTVMQYWGIRLDQNQDLVNNFQYPANPAAFVNTANDTRLFDPAVQNNTFNGRNANQYIYFEDYSGNGRDDTPPDIHYEAGLGCIDCHGSHDLHTSGSQVGYLFSRQDQVTQIRCESCHGTIDSKAARQACTDWNNQPAECAVDAAGNVLDNVTYSGGQFWLRSRLSGQTFMVPQTKSTVDPNDTTINPVTQQAIYSPKASYAMGRINNNAADGIGPRQANLQGIDNFTHTDNLECATCHSTWTNNCMGCHLETLVVDPAQQDLNNQFFFSNLDGEQIMVAENAADFVYQNPIHFTLGIGSDGRVVQSTPAEKVWYRATDGNNTTTPVAFSDRLGQGNATNTVGPENGLRDAAALGHNAMAGHSIRGKVDNSNEGPHACNSCHFNQDMVNNAAQWAEFIAFADIIVNRDYAAYANNNYFAVLQEQIGQNENNVLNSPYYVWMASGIGTGLYQFDAFGCPNNPLDANANRQYCQNGAPANNFDPANTVYDLDATVTALGVANASNTHPSLTGTDLPLRFGTNYPAMSGPFGPQLLNKLVAPANPNNAIILDSWIDADGNLQGNAANYVQFQ